MPRQLNGGTGGHGHTTIAGMGSTDSICLLTRLIIASSSATHRSGEMAPLLAKRQTAETRAPWMARAERRSCSVWVGRLVCELVFGEFMVCSRSRVVSCQARYGQVGHHLDRRRNCSPGAKTGRNKSIVGHWGGDRIVGIWLRSVKNGAYDGPTQVRWPSG